MNKPSFIVEDVRKMKFRKKESDFKILSMKNTTLYVAGSYLSESEVNELISCGFEVSIKAMKKE